LPNIGSDHGGGEDTAGYNDGALAQRLALSGCSGRHSDFPQNPGPKLQLIMRQKSDEFDILLNDVPSWHKLQALKFDLRQVFQEGQTTRLKSREEVRENLLSIASDESVSLNLRTKIHDELNP
jgi:hypothetical protein